MTREEFFKNMNESTYGSVDPIQIAIKALEKGSCEDTISRQELLDKKWDVPYDGKYIQVVDVGDIKELPSVTPKKDEWIPCDVRLPKQNEYIGNVCKYYLVQDKYDDMYVARYTKKGWNPIDTLFFLDEVVAWMPLPKRYEYEGAK